MTKASTSKTVTTGGGYIVEVEDGPLRSRKYQAMPQAPRIRRASWISRCMMVTLFACIAHKLLDGSQLKHSNMVNTYTILTRPRINEPGMLPMPPAVPG
jgi:hypothetical protein